MQLAELSDLKSFLDIATTSHDDLLTMILNHVSKRIETYLNRELYKQSRSLYFDAGRKVFSLPAYPIDLTATLTVTIDDVSKTINDDFFVWENKGIIELSYVPSYVEPKQIYITWTGGYATTSALPYDIQMATIMQCAFVFRRRKDIGLASISMPDGSVSVQAPTKLLQEVEQVLKSYRRRPM